MKKLLYATLFLCPLMTVGCRFAEYVTTPDPVTGSTPLVDALAEISSGGLSGIEKGSLFAGVVGLLFTTTKTGIRLWGRYRASRSIGVHPDG